jgi:uncharacterized MnhB-related membrane protein
MIIFVAFLIIIMLSAAISVCIFRNLINAVIASCVVSLITAILFYFLQAPDVAIAEASIGAALVTAIFVITIRRTKKEE